MKVNRKAKLEKKITYSNLSFAVHLFGYSSLKTGRERRRWEVIDHPRLQSSWLKLKINWIKKERYWDAIITAYGSSCLHSFHHSPTFYLEMKTFLSSCPSDSNWGMVFGSSVRSTLVTAVRRVLHSSEDQPISPAALRASIYRDNKSTH